MHKIAKYGIINISLGSRANLYNTTKGETEMKKIFYGLAIALIALAVYAAGQIKVVLPNPEYFFWGAVVAVLLLIFGYFCGEHESKTKVPKKKNSSSQGEHTVKWGEVRVSIFWHSFSYILIY